jgi:hypothetical protein
MENAVKTPLAEKLRMMASFESMFAKENLLLGLNVWLKSTGIMLVINLVASFTGISAMLGATGTFVFLAAGFYLMYRAIAQEAWERYKIRVLSSCWWSFYWRVLVFIIPVIFLLTLMLPESYIEMTPEQMAENPEPIFYLQIAALVLSIIPSGLAASRAILVSFLRLGGAAVTPDEKKEDDGGENNNPEQQ